MIRFRQDAKLDLVVGCTVAGWPHSDPEKPFYSASGVPSRAKAAHDRTAQWFKANAETAWPNNCVGEQHVVAIAWTPFVPGAAS